MLMSAGGAIDTYRSEKYGSWCYVMWYWPKTRALSP